MPKSQARIAARQLNPLLGWSAFVFLTLGVLVAGMARAQEGPIIENHGYSFYGDLKYPADFAHFDYVNPDAPKGGEIAISALGTFDSMNPYSRKGRGGGLSTVM